MEEFTFLSRNFVMGNITKKNLMGKLLGSLVVAAVLKRISFINSYLIFNPSIIAL